MALSKEQADRIAVLINRICVSQLMLETRHQHTDDEGFTRRWLKAEAEAVVELADEHGIVLPTLNSARGLA